MSDFILSNLPWFWLGMAIIFVLIEVFTTSLTTIWAAISAFVMIFLSMTKVDFKWQFLIFPILTFLLLIFTRPFAVKKLKAKIDKNDVNSIVGQNVTIVSDLNSSEKIEGKTQNGVIWTILADKNQNLETGNVCKITEVIGNSLKVEKE